jgi:hypothetical protein
MTRKLSLDAQSRRNFRNRRAQGGISAESTTRVVIETLENRQFLTSVGLVPTQDAYVRDGSFSNTNFGSAADLQVKDAPSGSGYTRNAYLQFNLAGQSPIQSAILEIDGGQSSTTTESSIPISAHAVTSNSWTQSGIKFSNAPAISSATLATATITGTNHVFYFIDLTTYFKQQQAGGHTTASLALKGSAVTGAYADFESTNGANVPVLLLQTGSPTPTPTPTPTTTGFGPSADAYVQDGQFANQNFGSSTTLQVKQSDASGFTRVSYLTFDLSSISSSATINNATLSVFGNVNGSSPVQVDALQVPGATFNQGTITYNNAPVTGTKITSAVVSGTSATKYTFNLTNYVQADISAGQSQVTIALAGDSITLLFASFNSTNAASNAPALAVSYQ